MGDGEAVLPTYHKRIIMQSERERSKIDGKAEPTTGNEDKITYAQLGTKKKKSTYYQHFAPDSVLFSDYIHMDRVY